jgi:drug/metabolite transporter (DMT)-like permease
MWIFYAIGASMFLGLTYLLGEHIYKKISVATTLAIMFFVSAVVMSFISLIRKDLQKDISTLGSDSNVMMLIIAVTLTYILAELCIGFSIVSKNAALTGLIETSYPIFIVLFSYLIFHENQVTPGAVAGAVLIFSGVFVVYLFHQ